jgi:hypothetical protein
VIAIQPVYWRVGRIYKKTQLLPLLRVGPYLQSCCLATRWSNPLHFVYHGRWAHLNGMFHKFCHHFVHVYICTPLSLLGNGSINAFPRQSIYAIIEEFLDASFPIRSASKQMIARASVCVSPILVHVPPKRLSESSQSHYAEKYGYDSRGTRKQESLCWREPSAILWTGLVLFFSLLCFFLNKKKLMRSPCYLSAYMSVSVHLPVYSLQYSLESL